LAARDIKMTIERREFSGSDLGKEIALSRGNRSDGIYYHPLTRLRLTYRPKNTPAIAAAQTETFVIPDYEFTECLSLRRAAMVKQKTDLTFSNGMLKKIVFSRPSQGLAVIKIPQKIISTAAEAIPEIIKIRNETATSDLKQDTALLQAQEQYLQAEIDLKKKEAELKALQEEQARNKPSSNNNVAPTPTPGEAH
jgi:hypothetical protein